MNLNPNLKLPGRKTALIAGIAIGLAAGLAYLVYDFLSSPPKPWYVRWQVKRYISRQTQVKNFKVDFNFNLAGEVATLRSNLSLMETNVALNQAQIPALQKEVTGLTRLINAQTDVARRLVILSNRQRELVLTLTKIPDALTNLPAATLTNAEALLHEAETLKPVTEPIYGPLQPVRNEIAGWEKEVSGKLQALASDRRDLAAIQKQLATGKKTEGTNITNLNPAELSALSNQVAALETGLPPKQTEIAELNKKISLRQAELNEKYLPVAAQLRQLRLLTNRASEIASAQAALLRGQTDLTSAHQDVDARTKDLNLATATVAEHQKQLEERKQKLADLRKKNTELYAALATRRKEFNEKKLLADAQQNDFSAQFRKKYAEADTYGQMYGLLGQQLEVAGQLLSNTNAQQRRAGLVVAVQAADMCATYIQNSYLAARVFEGYVMPFIGLADDARPRMLLNPDSLAQQMVAYYRAAQEPDHVVDMLKRAIKSAKTTAAADQHRWQLGREYEFSGQFGAAASAYRSIVNTNSYRAAINQIPYLERRAQRQ